MRIQFQRAAVVALSLIAFAVGQADASVVTQCPGDIDGDCIPDQFMPDGSPNPEYDPNVASRHIGAGDGFAKMADGKVLYCFGFSDLTGVPETMAMHHGMLAASIPAPTITAKEGQKLYLNLTNVGMMMRPDLFDPHTIHWHGFPNAAPIFDGMPDGATAINMGATFTYFYKVVEPGTYMYHCHVEATEHMEMGMLGNLYVFPKQNDLPDGTHLGGFEHETGNKYVYNDGDGSTRYDVEVPLQMSSFDDKFHAASDEVQPLPFAALRADYALLNGRGYPDTITTGPLEGPEENGGIQSQVLSSLIEAKQGQKILLRLSNLDVTRFFTFGCPSIPMKVVGYNARLLRGPTGKSLAYETNSLTLGGGESYDAIMDTANVTPGTYVMYTNNLHHLSNNQQDFGGIMTEIIIRPPSQGGNQ